MGNARVVVGGDVYVDPKKNEFCSSIWGDLPERIVDADMAIINVESPITDSTYYINKTGPCIKMEPNISPLLKIHKKTVATLSNNHIRDYGDQGVKDTIAHLNKYDIETVGAGLNINEAKRILNSTINGVNLSIINVSENEWATASEDKAGANGLVMSQLISDILKAKLSSDFILLIIHGGNEYYELPSPMRKNLYRALIELGANAVVSHHSHCISGYEVYKGAPIFYSIGNLLFPKENSTNTWNQSLIVELVFIKNEGVKFNIIPIVFDTETFQLKSPSKTVESSILESVKCLSGTIADDTALLECWNNYCEAQYFKICDFIFLPRIIRFAINKLGLKFSFQRLVFRLVNFVRCESHKDVLITMIENRNKI